jgi:hypothetical protein
MVVARGEFPANWSYCAMLKLCFANLLTKASQYFVRSFVMNVIFSFARHLSFKTLPVLVSASLRSRFSMGDSARFSDQTHPRSEAAKSVYAAATTGARHAVGIGVTVSTIANATLKRTAQADLDAIPRG